jgi:hypothetical protein
MNGSPALRRELIELIGRLEDAAHAVVPAAAAYLAELALSDDHQPQRVAEQLGELQDDLLRLRWLIEDGLAVDLRQVVGPPP